MNDQRPEIAMKLYAGDLYIGTYDTMGDAVLKVTVDGTPVSGSRVDRYRWKLAFFQEGIVHVKAFTTSGNRASLQRVVN